MMVTTDIIHTHQLTIGYRRKDKITAVQTNLNLSIRSGEMVCLIGANGCGKSTLLRSIGGLQPLLGGEVYIQNKKIDEQSLRTRARLIALVLTDRVEVSNLTVEELVAMGRTPYTDSLGSLSKEDIERVDIAIEQVHLTDFRHRLLNELSDGERQRAMLAKALAQDTPVILLDEPTAHLDLPNRVEMMLLLSRLAHETGKAVILSTHELDLALQTSDHLWLMSPHGGIEVGTPEDLVLSHSFEQVFASPHFGFDILTGNFTLHHDSTSRLVRLIPEEPSLIHYWTNRALLRAGFALSTEAPFTISLNNQIPEWTLTTPHSSFTFSSIDLLLQKLKE